MFWCGGERDLFNGVYNNEGTAVIVIGYYNNNNNSKLFMGTLRPGDFRALVMSF